MSISRRDSSGIPAKGARCLTWDCPRKPWTVAGMGSGLSMRARAEITGKYAGEVREGVEEGQGADAGRGLLGHGLEPGQRAPAPGGGGQAPAGPWGPEFGEGCASTPNGRSEDPPAGAGRRRRAVRQAPQGVHAAAARPAEGGAVRFDGEPRREPDRQGRAGWP